MSATVYQWFSVFVQDQITGECYAVQLERKRSSDALAFAIRQRPISTMLNEGHLLKIKVLKGFHEASKVWEVFHE